MSHFGTTLKSLMSANRMTGKDLADKTGISESLISRWTKGHRNFVSHPDLVAIADAVGRSRVEKAELLAARLRDEASGPPWMQLVQITINGKEPPERKSTDIEYLRNALVRDPKLGELIRSLVAVHRNGH